MPKAISKTIDIAAVPETVWQVFVNPDITRQMGGEYVSKWETGSAFGWKGADGKMYTNGTILNIQPGKLLQHNLYAEDGSTVSSVITYVFNDHNGGTRLAAQEELSAEPSEEAYEEMSQGWDAALQAVKDLAEKL